MKTIPSSDRVKADQNDPTTVVEAAIADIQQDLQKGSRKEVDLVAAGAPPPAAP